MGSKGKALILAKDGFIEWWGLRGEKKHITIRMHKFEDFEESRFENDFIENIVWKLKRLARREKENGV